MKGGVDLNNIEIERKYVIMKPDVELMKKLADYTVSEIEQVYLTSAPRITHRVRSRTFTDKTVYTETKKVRIDSISSYEDEAEISENEFLTLKKNIRPDTQPVLKVRHTFRFCDQLFEVDVYPQWKSTAIMETELSDAQTIVRMPDFIEIVREVTGDKNYSNASMSRTFPKELV